MPGATLGVSPVASGATGGSGMDRGLGIKLGAPMASPACSLSLISRLRDEDTAAREKWHGPHGSLNAGSVQPADLRLREDLRLFQNRQGWVVNAKPPCTAASRTIEESDTPASYSGQDWRWHLGRWPWTEGGPCPLGPGGWNWASDPGRVLVGCGATEGGTGNLATNAIHKLI